MKKTKLKPYVYKIKGAKNYALYDLIKGNFYTITPEGNLEQLKKSLKEAELTIETEGIVPFKVEIPMHLEEDVIKIKELQIRLNGKSEDNCWNREKIGDEKRYIDKETLNLLKQQLTHIPVKKVHIEAESNALEEIIYILKEFHAAEFVLVVEEGLDDESYSIFKLTCDKLGKSLKYFSREKKDMTDLKVKIYDFFYSRHFNPCLGHKVAVDCGGEIKPCLWWHDSIGIIARDNLKEMINREVFDEYWYSSKDRIDTCKDCELRYACPDCRISHRDRENTLKKKPAYCNYNPFTGGYDEPGKSISSKP